MIRITDNIFVLEDLAVTKSGEIISIFHVTYDLNTIDIEAISEQFAKFSNALPKFSVIEKLDFILRPEQSVYKLTFNAEYKKEAESYSNIFQILLESINGLKVERYKGVELMQYLTDEDFRKKLKTSNHPK